MKHRWRGNKVGKWQRQEEEKSEQDEDLVSVSVSARAPDRRGMFAVTSVLADITSIRSGVHKPTAPPLLYMIRPSSQRLSRRLIEGDSKGSDIDTCCMMRIKDPPTPCQEHRQLSVCVHLLIMPISVSFLVVALFVFIPWFSLCVCVCVDSLVVFFFLKRCFLVKSCSLGVEGEQTGETLPR